MLAIYLEQHPEMLDNYDTDQIARDVGRASGMRERWIMPEDARDQRRKERAEQQAKAEQAEQAERMIAAGSMAAQSGLIDKVEEQGG